MKKTLLIALSLICSIAAYSQEAPTRALSKYADDRFGKDDRYSVVTPYQTVTVKQPEGKKIKNVIFMIGDGMGLEMVTCGWVLNGGSLNMTNCPYVGYSLTYAANALITDSAAGGTALAVGQKTKYGYIGVDTLGNPVQSILHYSKEMGKKTGVTVTCRINDATPADFCCHSTKRSEEAEIAAQYVESGVDFISGGGWQFWSQRTDGRNLVEEMKAKGYSFVDKVEDIKNVKSGRFLGLFAPLETEPALDRGPLLEESTMKAIELMDNEKGFFLMVEGSCIDDYLHHHKIGMAAEELFDFDRTVGKVLEWAEKDGETLVVITADHATGGLTLLKGNLDERYVMVNFSTKGHNGIAVPVFAYGPHAEEFAAIQENSELAMKIKDIIKKYSH